MTIERDAIEFAKARAVKQYGARLFAVRRPLSLADRIASASHRGLRSNWPHADRCAGRARVVHA